MSKQNAELTDAAISIVDRSGIHAANPKSRSLLQVVVHLCIKQYANGCPERFQTMDIAASVSSAFCLLIPAACSP